MPVYNIQGNALIHPRAIPMMLENIGIGTFEADCAVQMLRFAFLRETFPALPQDVAQQISEGKLKFETDGEAAFVNTEKVIEPPEEIPEHKLRLKVHVVMSEGKNGGICGIFYKESDAEEWIEQQDDDVQYYTYQTTVR